MNKFKKHLIDNLPNVYATTPDSNNYKLLQLVEYEFEKRAAEDQALVDILDLTNCTGKTLDLYGEMFKQPRGVATDSQYRYMIRAKIAQLHVKSDYESIANAVCLTFNCEPNEFKMEEGNCSVKITMLPLKVIDSAGFTVNQTISLIKSLIPAGISLISAEFEGTFEFAAGENENDETAGFTDEEGYSSADTHIGGYLGYIGSTLNEPILPI